MRAFTSSTFGRRTPAVPLRLRPDWLNTSVSLRPTAPTIRGPAPACSAYSQNVRHAYKTYQQLRFLNVVPPPDYVNRDGTEARRKLSASDLRRRAGNVQFSWSSAILAFATGSIVIFYFAYINEAVRERQKIAIIEHESLGTPKLGGPWTLFDRQGFPFASENLRGKYYLLYFGFSFCPDICPEEMEKQAAVIDKLDHQFGKGVVEPVFISVDPNRDTIAQLDFYCSEFLRARYSLPFTPTFGYDKMHLPPTYYATPPPRHVVPRDPPRETAHATPE